MVVSARRSVCGDYLYHRGIDGFEKDITEMLSPSLYKVENVGDRRLNPSEPLEKVNAQTDENLIVTSLEYSGQPDGTARISYREKGKEQLFVDPYTG